MYVLLIVICPFVLFLLAIVLSVLLRCTNSDCPFGIFKLFLLYPVVAYILRSGRVSSSCSTSDIRRVNLVTNQVISHERGKDHWNLHTLYCSQKSTSLTAGLPLPTYLCYVTMWSISKYVFIILLSSVDIKWHEYTKMCVH
jgi:hypothetical protein